MIGKKLKVSQLESEFLDTASWYLINDGLHFDSWFHYEVHFIIATLEGKDFCPCNYCAIQRDFVFGDITK